MSGVTAEFNIEANRRELEAYAFLIRFMAMPNFTHPNPLATPTKARKTPEPPLTPPNDAAGVAFC